MLHGDRFLYAGSDAVLIESAADFELRDTIFDYIIFSLYNLGHNNSTSGYFFHPGAKWRLSSAYALDHDCLL